MLKYFATSHSNTSNHYNFDKGDYTKARNLINQFNWKHLFGYLNAEESWNILKDHLNKLLKAAFLSYQVQRKKKHPYITAKAIKLKPQ